MLVLHRCDNPRWVRPDHLVLGTNADNMQDIARATGGGRGQSAGGTTRVCASAMTFAKPANATVEDCGTQLAKRYGVHPST
jgi:hypothetical protein